MNHPQRINPNKELLGLQKMNQVLRKQGLNQVSINSIDAMILKFQRDDEWEFCQKLPLAIFGIVINVLHGNHYMSKKKIEIAMEEMVDLYKEIDLALLDMDDVLNYCEKEVGMRVELDRKEIFDDGKPEFKISTMETHQNRTISVLEQVKAELDKALADDPDNSEALSQYRLFNNLTEKFRKVGIIV